MSVTTRPYKPYHINATTDDLDGNEGIGRYLLLPGSDGRAHEIAKYFNNVEVKKHPRGHNLYTGTMSCEGKTIDMATISTGMGCPSMEIILHELFHLGGKRFLRIGTAGSLQPWVKMGDIVNAQASVRDENTTTHYAPLEVPAVASLEYASSILLAAEKMGLSDHLHTGTVHCKGSLYAREHGLGPRGVENNEYISLLSKMGILASEMETAALFIQTQFYNNQLTQRGTSHQNRVLAGAIVAIIATMESNFEMNTSPASIVKNSIELALESVKTLAMQEMFA
jgi:uridine phosphorylase